MYIVTKDFKFEAAHSLPHLPEGHKCRRLHGHSYVFRVGCRGMLDDRGFVIDYSEISQICKPLVERLDHRNLNDILDVYTTAENLAKYIWDSIIPEMPQLHTVTVFETATTSVIYGGVGWNGDATPLPVVRRDV